MESIGLLAGGGALPRLVAEEARSKGKKVVICGIQGHTDDSLYAYADISETVHIGQFSKMIKFFQKNNVKEVSLVGTINKPKVLDIRPDLLAAKILFSLKSKGDDSLLRAVLDQLEKEGLKIVSAAKLMPSLLAPKGVLTKSQPDEYVENTARYALPIIKSLGEFDMGQCLSVKENMVLAVECIEGTDAAIKRGGELGAKGDAQCVLVKMVKTGQDERVDLPSIGLKTVENLIEYNYKALIIEAHKTLFFDSVEAIQLADKHKLIIWAIDKEEAI